MLSEERRKELVETISGQVFRMMLDCYEVENGSGDVDRYYCREAVRRCLEAKASLIEMLEKHPNWDEENLRVHFDADYTRPVDTNAAACNLRVIGAEMWMDIDVYPLYHDDVPGFNGYTVYVARKEDWPNTTELNILAANLQDSNTFKNVFLTPSITKEGEAIVRYCLPDAHIHAGTKSTRALLKLLRQYGWEDALAGVNPRDNINPVTGEVKTEDALARARRQYTQFADNMNELKVKRHTVLSVNPMDFLRMSYGNSWSSCHHISTDAYDDSGCYSAGCWSYAYDNQTIIFYTVDADVSDVDITYAGKYTRQLYFWNGHALAPCRVYPYELARDNLSDPVYAENRQIVEQIVADCEGFGNMWKKTNATLDRDHVRSYGLQYPDYFHHTYHIYTPSFLEQGEDAQQDEFLQFEIGSNEPICVCCGDYLDENDYPICSSCAGRKTYACDCCGDVYYSEDDLTWAVDRYGNDVQVCQHCIDNGDYVWDEYNERYISGDIAVYVENYGYIDEDSAAGSDMFFECDECGRWHLSDEASETGDGLLVCQYCFRTYFVACERCGEVYRKSDMTLDEDGNWVCDDCIEEDEFECDNCHRLHKRDDIGLERETALGVTYLYCKDCAENHRHICKDCGMEYWTQPDSTSRNESLGLCRHCFDEFYEYNYNTGEYELNIARRDRYEDLLCVAVITTSGWTTVTNASASEVETYMTGLHPSRLVAVLMPVAEDDPRSISEISFGRANSKNYEVVPIENERAVAYVNSFLERMKKYPEGIYNGTAIVDRDNNGFIRRFTVDGVWQYFDQVNKCVKFEDTTAA